MQAYNQSAGSSGSLMEDLRKYLDLFNDYATIRVYWKFYDDKRMEVPAAKNRDPRLLKRAYYLFINKTKQIIELDKNDARTVIEYCSQQINNNVIMQANVSAQLREASNTAQLPRQINSRDFIEQDQFWRRLMDHFKGQRQNFCLQNIEFCVEKLFGLAKYPINVWNQLELTNNDLKYNLNTQKSRLSFFLKSATSVLHATTANAVGYSYPYNLSGTGNPASGLAGGGSKDKSGNSFDMKQILNGRVLTMDGIFQRMVKVNNMDKYEYDKVNSNYQHKLNQLGPNRMAPHGSMNNLFQGGGQNINQMDQLSINNLSSKHMGINQLLIAMGRGEKVERGKISKILEGQKNAQSRKVKNGKLEDIDSFERS